MEKTILKIKKLNTEQIGKSIPGELTVFRQIFFLEKEIF